MKKKECPYLGYSEEEVATLESSRFVLHFGGDFVLEDREYSFTKQEASRLHKKYLKDLLKIIDDGNKKDRDYALALVSSLAIHPLRLH